tara:strand:- start:1857 stop:3779 length:1923 start_codon:yes stop_codon:yes gene_type:complete
MYIKLLLVLLLSGIFSDLNGQSIESSSFNKKDLSKFENAQKEHKNKQVNKALKVYCKLLDKYSGHPDLELWTGLAYKDIGKNKEALRHLKFATDNGKSTNALLYSTIGELCKKEKKYEEAIENYEKYLSIADSSKRGYFQVQHLYEEARFTNAQIKNPVLFNPISISSNVNTSSSEYLPQFTADHAKMYFTRRLNGQEDIFFVEKTENGYGKAEPFILINTENFDEGAHSISADGNTFIFTHHDDKYGMGGHDLYITSKNNGEWSRPKNMGRKVNSVFWDSQPSLSGDGNILFFSSTREGGYGGKDIWYSILSKEGFWSSPINAGNVVNTSTDESSPFLHTDMRTLYFRSNGHIGMGSFDLFVARRKKGGGWSEVKNLGYPINTEGQEGALSISLDGTKGYFATDYDGKVLQDHLDIYEFELPMDIRPEPCTYLKIRSIDAGTKIPVGSILEIIDISTNTIISSKKVDFNGEVLIPIPLRQKMMINLTAEGYIFYSDHIIIDSIAHGMAPFDKTIHLTKIPAPSTFDEGKSFVLKNVFFESGTAELQQISLMEIKKLADILMKNEKLKLKIIGHTDNVGEDYDNKVLSEKRASSVKEALISLGIQQNRLVTEGKGESAPVQDNSTEAGRNQNRRTEFILY